MISSYFHDSSSTSSNSFPLNIFTANGTKAEKKKNGSRTLVSQRESRQIYQWMPSLLYQEWQRVSDVWCLCDSASERSTADTALAKWNQELSLLYNCGPVSVLKEFNHHRIYGFSVGAVVPGLVYGRGGICRVATRYSDSTIFPFCSWFVDSIHCTTFVQRVSNIQTVFLVLWDKA